MELLRNLIKGFEEKTGIEFKGELKINGRLTRVLGRCQAIVYKNPITGQATEIKPVGIQISKKFLEIATPEEVVGVLAHEYAHYCTYATAGEHDHSNPTFKKYCELLETTHAPSISTKNKIKNKYDIHCSCCGKLIGGKTTARAGVVQHPHRYKSRCCGATVNVTKNF